MRIATLLLTLGLIAGIGVGQLDAQRPAGRLSAEDYVEIMQL